MRVHITLVGGQTLPLYFGIRHAEPDRIVLLHSKETLEQASSFEKFLDTKTLGAFTQLQELPTTDGKDIKKTLESLMISEEDEVSLNLSGGLKLWTISVYEFFRQRASSIFYIDQNNLCFSLPDGISTQLNTSIKIDDFFRLAGYSIDQTKSYGYYSESDREAVMDIEDLRRSNNRLFNHCFMTSTKNDKPLSPKEKERLIEIDRSPSCVHVRWKGVFRGGEKEVEKSIESDHALELMTDARWFELKCAVRLREIFEDNELCLDTTIESDVPNQTRNEIDIIVNLGSKLLFVECKTQVSDSKDIEKIANTAKRYGGTGSKVLLMTLESLKPNIATKCRDNNIMTFSFYSSTDDKARPHSLRSILSKLQSSNT